MTQLPDHTVSLHGIAYSFAHNKTRSGWVALRAGYEVKNKVRRCDASTASHYQLEIGRRSQPMWLREHSDSDLVAALATAGRENGATGTGTHTQAEAMLLVTLAVVRLESALHDELRWFWGKIWTTVAVKGQTVRNPRCVGQTGEHEETIGDWGNPFATRVIGCG